MALKAVKYHLIHQSGLFALGSLLTTCELCAEASLTASARSGSDGAGSIGAEPLTWLWTKPWAESSCRTAGTPFENPSLEGCAALCLHCHRLQGLAFSYRGI